MRADPDRTYPPGLTPPPRATPAPDFTEWYEQHFAFVWRCVRRLGVQSAQLDDAVQDVFLVVHRKLSEYQPNHSPRAWLFSIARRVASDHRRRTRRKGGHASLPSDMPAAERHGPQCGAERNQAAEILQHFVEQLDEDHAAAFVLVELEQMTAPEVAEALSTDATTVYTRVRTARARLKKYVESHHRDYWEQLDG